MFEMEDLPYKPGLSNAELEEGARREWQSELKKREAAAKRKATRDANAKRKPATVHQTARVGSRPVKKLPPMRTPGEQPRDANGRWVKAGKALWTGTKATGRAAKHVLFGTAAVIGGTVAAAQSGHKIVKKGMRKKSTVKRKRVVRRRKR